MNSLLGSVRVLSLLIPRLIHPESLRLRLHLSPSTPLSAVSSHPLSQPSLLKIQPYARWMWIIFQSLSSGSELSQCSASNARITRRDYLYMTTPKWPKIRIRFQPLQIYTESQTWRWVTHRMPRWYSEGWIYNCCKCNTSSCMRAKFTSP